MVSKRAEQLSHQNSTTPDTGATQLGAIFPPPGGRCWGKTETQNGSEEPDPAFGALVFAGVRMGEGIAGKEGKEGEGKAVATPLPLP